MRERARAILTQAAPWLQRHAFWLALPLAALAVIVTALVVGSMAAERAEAWGERHREARATAAIMEGWSRQLVPPTPAESASWRASARSARERGIEAADRVALMQRVAERAEGLGVGDVQVGFVRADTLQVHGVREVSGDIFELAPYALSLRFMADYATIARVMGALPPQVDVHRARLVGAGTGVDAELILLVYLGVES